MLISAFSLSLFVTRFNIVLFVGSADTCIVDINANSIVVKDTGVVTLTISSKQDYSLNKAITVYVINALSDLINIFKVSHSAIYISHKT